MSDKQRMGRDEWLSFKSWVWLVGIENAPKILGLADETFEAVWMRDFVAARTIRKVRGAMEKGANRDALA